MRDRSTLARPAGPDGGQVLVDEYVRTLGGVLTGPRRLKADLLREARDGLVDAVEGYRDQGLSVPDAQRRAVAEFGTVGELAATYQAELAAGAARRLSLVMVLVPGLITALGDLLWRGSPWATSAGPLPPAGYRFVSQAQDYVGYAFAALAVAAYALLWWTARRGRPVRPGMARAMGLGTLAIVGLNLTSGVVMYAWSVRMWDAALTWPPMMIGSALICAGYGWLGRSAIGCLAAARR